MIADEDAPPSMKGAGASSAPELQARRTDSAKMHLACNDDR